MKRIRLNYGENLAEFSSSFKKKIRFEIEQNFDKLSLYPDFYQNEFINAIADYYGIKTETIVSGAGIKGLLDLFIRTFIKKGDKVLLIEPSYYMYEQVARGNGAGIEKIRLRKDKINLNQIINKKWKMAIIGNPNNPTGDYIVGSSALRKIGLSNKEAIILVDECYSIYPNDSLIGKLPKNGVILKSFSKMEGLAGIRLGYAIGNKTIIKQVKEKQKTMDPLNVSGLSYMVGKLTLKYNNKRSNFLKLKRKFYTKLKRIKQLEIEDTKTTFIKVNLEKTCFSPKKFCKEMEKFRIDIKDPSNYKGFPKQTVLMGVPKEKDQKYVIDSIKKIICS